MKTPAIDGLAAKGLRFTDFYSGYAVCSPSRATLLSGRHHIRAGVYSWINDASQNSHLREREVTLAEVLKAEGYATAHVGKWHLGLPTLQRNKPTPDKHGFDHWFATWNNASPSHHNPDNFIRNGKPVGKLEGYSCQLVVDEAIQWLESRRNDPSPFFLNVWFHEPHAPIAAPEEIVSVYGDFSLVADPDYELPTDNMFREAWIPIIKRGGYKNFQLFDLNNDPNQTTNVAANHPEQLDRMKQELLRINASIMNEAHDWHEEQ